MLNESLSFGIMNEHAMNKPYSSLKRNQNLNKYVTALIEYFIPL